MVAFSGLVWTGIRTKLFMAREREREMEREREREREREVCGRRRSAV